MLQGVNRPFNETDDLHEVVEAIMPELSTDDYSQLTELTIEYVLQPGYDYGNESEYGLEVIFDGLQRLGVLA